MSVSNALRNFDFARNFEEVTSTSLDERRDHGRIHQCSLNTNCGLVLDMSRGGMRLLSSTRIHGNVLLKLRCDYGLLRIPAEVRWTKRRGIRQHEIGLQFHHVDEQVRQYLVEIALAHSMARAA